MTSWVARRIAHLEASSDCASVYSATSPSPARKEGPAIYHRERLQVQPVTTGPNETQAAVAGILPVPCEANTGAIAATATATAIHQHQQEELITNHAGGYFSKPRKQQVPCHMEGDDTLATIISADDITSQQQQQEHQEQQQQPESTRMSSKITQLEEALLVSQDRIAYLISSSAKAAENASRLRRETEAAAATEQAYARRVCQLQDTLAQAEKRASWLQGELQVVWACSTQRVGELKYELELARRQQSAGGGEMHTETCGGSSFTGGRSGGVLDKMMSDTQEALSNLRTKFYRAMGEKKKLKARCDHLEEELLNSVIHSNIITTSNGNNNGSVGNDSANTDTDSNNQHIRETSNSGNSSSSCGKEKEEINRREGGPTNSHGSRSSSRSNCTSGAGAGGGNDISHSISGSTTMAVEAAPVTTVGGKFSWRWPPLVRTGRS